MTEDERKALCAELRAYAGSPIRYSETDVDPLLAYAADAIDRLSRALADVTAERDRYKREIGNVNNEFGSQTAAWPNAWRRVADLKDDCRRYQQDIASARRDADRLRKALRQYGRHNNSCQCLNEWTKRECDCGLDAALAPSPTDTPIEQEGER